MTMMSKSFTPDARQGQATVEIALVLPMLLILLFGIIMGGFAFYAFIQVSNAAREGARAGSLYRITAATRPNGWTIDNEVKAGICDEVNDTSSLGFLVTTPPDCATSSFNVGRDGAVLSSGELAVPLAGDQLTVTVAYSYTMPVLSSFMPVFPRPIVIRRAVMMELQ